MMPTSIAAAHEQIVGLRAENERLRDYKRAQAEDIMTLGQQVGKLEAEIERMHDSGATSRETDDEIERLRVEITEWKTVYEACDKMRTEMYDQLGEALATNARLRAVLRPLLEHYLDCYDGNKDQLAINTVALLGNEQIATPKIKAQDIIDRYPKTLQRLKEAEDDEQKDPK